MLRDKAVSPLQHQSMSVSFSIIDFTILSLTLSQKGTTYREKYGVANKPSVCIHMRLLMMK